VLDVYHRPHDPKRPQVNLDETSKQLVGEARPPVPAVPGRAERYVRNGTANLFVAFERSGNRRPPRDPLAGWRHVAVTDTRKRTDWAHFVRDLLDGRYKEADRVVLVMDQLNTHSVASLYEAFAPAEAKRLADKLEIHHTPEQCRWFRHGVAEVELSVLSRQCLADRMGDKATLAREVAAWEQQRNAAGATVDWRFTTADARIKLKRLYPVQAW
jgi:hypothetical protein